MWHRRFAVLSLLAIASIVCFQSAQASTNLRKKEIRMQSSYELLLERVFTKLDESVRGNAYPEPLNASLRPTIEGGLRFLSRRDLPAAKLLLKEAMKIHPDNPLPHLIYADIAVLEGRRDVAGRSYFDFWHRTQKEAEFLRGILNPEDRELVGTHISGRLFLYGLDLPDSDRPQDFSLKLRIPIEKKPFLNQLLSVGLPAIVGVGIPFFIFRRHFSADPSPTADRLLLQVYAVILATYFLWLAHSLFKVKPFFLTPELEVASVLGGGLAGVVALYFLGKVWEHERDRFDPSTVFCRHCGKSILKVAALCPYCNK
jgi:hypothetical protein